MSYEITNIDSKAFRYKISERFFAGLVMDPDDVDSSQVLSSYSDYIDFVLDSFVAVTPKEGSSIEEEVEDLCLKNGDLNSPEIQEILNYGFSSFFLFML